MRKKFNLRALSDKELVDMVKDESCKPHIDFPRTEMKDIEPKPEQKK